MGNDAAQPSRSLVFDHLALFSMVQNPRFLAHVQPVFAPGSVERLRKIADAALSGKGCPSCGLLVDAVQPMMTELGGWLENNPGGPVTTFIECVTEARGYRPDPVIIYWRRPDGLQGVLNL